MKTWSRSARCTVHTTAGTQLKKTSSQERRARRLTVCECVECGLWTPVGLLDCGCHHPARHNTLLGVALISRHLQTAVGAQAVIT